MKVVDYGAIHSISVNEGAGIDDLVASFYLDDGGGGSMSYMGKELHRIFQDEMTAKERNNFSEKLEEVRKSGFKTLRWSAPHPHYRRSAFPETPITTDQIESHIRELVRGSSDPLKTAGDLIVLFTTAAYEAANDG